MFQSILLTKLFKKKADHPHHLGKDGVKYNDLLVSSMVRLLSPALIFLYGLAGLLLGIFYGNSFDNLLSALIITGIGVSNLSLSTLAVKKEWKEYRNLGKFSVLNKVSE